MSLEQLSRIVGRGYDAASWTSNNDEAFEALFGSKQGRYPGGARNSVALRDPAIAGEEAVPFAAFINPENGSSGMYAGMSFAIFPVENAPCLVTFVVGTLGLGADEVILGRPGHARKLQAICRWLNKTQGNGQMVAWAKQDPVRTDRDLPDSIVKLFPEYQHVFKKYGKVLYAIYKPSSDEAAARKALVAFLDLMFEDRGFWPLAGSRIEGEEIRSEWFRSLMPDLEKSDVVALLKDRRYVVLQGPPGTGKTLMAQELLRDDYHGHGFSIQFHANSTYEEFVGGLSPVESSSQLGLRFSPKPGHLMHAAREALRNPDTPYLLHVDEINRADLSKVLGEAIYLLESETEIPRKIQLAYNFGPPFEDVLELPSNLHILGTRNTADRSLAILDVAIRRRFAFVDLWPQLGVVEEFGNTTMQQAFKDLTSVFVEHAGEQSFPLIPGHSYYLETDESKARRRLAIGLKPLLQEYLAQGYAAGFADEIQSYIQKIDALQGPDR